MIAHDRHAPSGARDADGAPARQLAVSVLRMLEDFDLRGVAAQAAMIAPITRSLERHAQKAARAQQLGLGPEFAAVHRRAAQRDRAHAARQHHAVDARLDERLGRSDWSDLAARTRIEFLQDDAVAVLDDVAERLRLALVEMDGLSAEAATWVAGMFDEALDAIRSDGLDGSVALLRTRLRCGPPAAGAPPMLDYAGAPSQHQVAEIGLLTAIVGVALVACMFAPFSWGSQAVAILDELTGDVRDCFCGDRR